MDISKSLIDEVVQISNSRLAETEKAKVKSCLLDYVGVSVAGEKMLRENVKAFNSEFNAGTFKLIHSESLTDLLSSSFLHGMISHAAELDDGHRSGMFHPGAPIFSALLPILQTRSFDIDQFYKAVICGYQISIKLARIMQPDLKKRGFHATGVAGTIGAGISAGMLLNFDKAKLHNTLSACCTAASGILKVIKDGSDMKPLNVAYAAQNGVTAALSAQAGFTGADDVLGSKLGFIDTFISENNSSPELINDTDFQIHDIYLKPHAACRHCHGPIDGTINLINKFKIDPGDIDRIDVDTYSLAIYGHDHQDIKGVNSAKMSIPYSVAVAATHGKADIELFDSPFIEDRSITSVIHKVFVQEDDGYTQMVPEKRPARVKIKMRNGEILSEEILLPKGEPESPITEEELADKVVSLLAYGNINQDLANQLINVIRNSNDSTTDTFIEFIYKL